MKQESGLRNSLKATRLRLGLSQQELAALAGVTRQTISGVEAGQYAPSTTVSLRLARALGCPVESLFWLEQAAPELAALPAEGLAEGEHMRVALANVGGRWVAHPLTGQQAFRTEFIPADGEGMRAPGSDIVNVRLLDEPANLARTVVLAGCTPALSLWARAAERWHPGLRVHWVFANSTAALARLARGEVHGAGVHLYDAESGEFNTPFVRRQMPGRPAVLVNLGVWEEGLLVRPGNPLGLKGAADLAQPGVRIVNREPGAGARILLEQALSQANVPHTALHGWERTVASHTAVAGAIAAGTADAGVSAAAMASAFGLGFVPLQRVRYDMVFPREQMQEEPVRQLLASLSHRWVRSQLEALGGFDTSRTGEIVAEVAP
ncbi:MAG: family transcriptional regulator [Firmicutes bacterium]|nr:family transcriptional regulator [Bacillota bacterium]